MELYGMIWNDMEWYGMIWDDMGLYGTKLNLDCETRIKNGSESETVTMPYQPYLFICVLMAAKGNNLKPMRSFKKDVNNDIASHQLQNILSFLLSSFLFFSFIMVKML